MHFVVVGPHQLTIYAKTVHRLSERVAKAESTPAKSLYLILGMAILGMAILGLAILGMTILGMMILGMVIFGMPILGMAILGMAFCCRST